MVSSTLGAPAFLHLAAHPVRWRLLSALAASDLRVRELVGLVGETQNLVSYHLRLLRDGGLVTATRSTLDGRDTYYHLDLDRCSEGLASSGGSLHPALRRHADDAGALGPFPPVAVLFVCTGNTARSPIAEALLRTATGGQVDVASAGSHPKPRMHPGTVRVLREQFDIDITGWHPRHLDSVAERHFDVVITLCDKAREACPDVADHPRRIHWSIPDPAANGDAPAGDVFTRTATDIHRRVVHLLPVLTTEFVTR
ncbi:ArsR family transcriptional regulator [Asanoa sp. NPDC049573]|uniref:arsenate reductase/protein-tyrosine-phosphatase family protein n=1 Tax=Asanoa sp. NPDC049573 TaxID=3155396 RepID=UPI003423D458